MQVNGWPFCFAPVLQPPDTTGAVILENELLHAAGAVFLAYVLVRWMAPAWAIWGLSKNPPGRVQWFSGAGRVVLAVALYAYIIML